MAQIDETDRPADNDKCRPPQHYREEAQASITESHRDDVLAQIRQRFKLTDS